MGTNEKSGSRITMEFLAKQAERIQMNIDRAETSAEKELWEDERKAFADNLRQCCGDSDPEINQVLGILGEK